MHTLLRTGHLAQKHGGGQVLQGRECTFGCGKPDHGSLWSEEHFLTVSNLPCAWEDVCMYVCMDVCCASYIAENKVSMAC
jgi:hypothetical protein